MSYKEIQLSDIIIDDDIDGCLRPLTLDEVTKLKESILREGCRDPIVVWKNDDGIYVVDGHNRTKVMKDIGKDKIKAVFLDFENKDQVKDWIITNQLSKRNLTKKEVDYYIGKQFALRKSSNHQSPRQTTSIDYGVSSKTVYNDVIYSEALDKISDMFGNSFKGDVLSNKVKSTKKDVIELSEKKEDLQKQVIDSIRNYDYDSLGTAIKKESLKYERSFYENSSFEDNIIIVKPDDKKLNSNKVKLMIIDIDDVKDLEALVELSCNSAKSVLEESGFLCFSLYEDNFNIADIMKISKNFGFVYYKTFIAIVDRSKKVKGNIITSWRPVIVFQKADNTHPLKNLVRDVFHTNSNLELNIKEDVYSRIISIFTSSGDFVFNPFWNKDTFEVYKLLKQFDNRNFLVVL